MLKWNGNRWTGPSVTRFNQHTRAKAAVARPPAPKGKSDSPLTSGGWETLSGMPNFVRANEIWKQRDRSGLEDVYATALIVYACVKKICMAAADAPPKIGAEKPRGWVDKPNHPLQALLKQPTPDMHYQEWVWHFLSHLLLTGESYVWKWRDNIGDVAQLWPLPTSFVTPVYFPDGNLSHYDVFQGANKARLPVSPRNMIRSMYPDPRRLGCGLGPLQAAMRDVQTDEERGDYIIEMLTNTRAPGTIVKTVDELSPEQEESIRAQINGGLGRGRRGRTMFLFGENVDINQMAAMKDLDWPGLANLGEARICAAFGVPPILIGLRVGLDASTYSNYGQARKCFYEDTMLAVWAKLDCDLTKGLLRDEEDTSNLEVYHDTSNVRALREDDNNTATRAAQLFSGGLITRNEAREMVGADPLQPAQGDVFVMPMSSTEVPLVTDQAPESGADANAEL